MRPHTLILGIGNILMGDEGVGVHVVRFIGQSPLPPDVVCLDGGTGGLVLMEPVQQARRVLLVDAMAGPEPPGTVQVLTPRFSSDYPRTLTAHDIGLKDLLDTLYVLGTPPDVTLFAITIALPCDIGMELSPPIAAIVPDVAARVLKACGT